MSNKKIIKEQKIKDVKDVYVVSTRKDFWKLTREKGIKVSKNNRRDMRFMAFLRTHRRDVNGKKIESAITHIAEVKETETNIPKKVAFEGYPEIIKRWGLKGTHKHYVLSGKPIELAHEIPLGKPKPRNRVGFFTTVTELFRAVSVDKIIAKK